MDNDISGGSDSDSFIFVSNGSSAGSDSENYVIVGRGKATGSEEDRFDERKQLLKNVHVGSDVSTNSEEDLSESIKQQLKIVNTDGYLGSDSEADLSESIKQQLKIADIDSYVGTDSEGDLSDSIKQQLKIVDSDNYVGTDSEGDLSDSVKQKLKNVDNDSYMKTDSEDYLSDESKQQLKTTVNDNYVAAILSVGQSKRKHLSCKYHAYPCKRIGRIDDCSDFPGEKRVIKKMDINDVTMEHVLPFLPAKILCRLKTVSKQWDQWISSAFFIHKQTHYFKKISGVFCEFPGASAIFISLDHKAYGLPRAPLSFLPEEVTVRTTCNGLLGCQSFNEEFTYYICNPVNKQWRVLPMSDYYHGPEAVLALAFEPSVLNFEANFELVCAFAVPGQLGIYFDIYSSRSNSWKLSDTVCYELEAPALNGNRLFLKGVVFWETITGQILALDLKENQYGMLPLPLSSGSQGVMTEMNGELHYILPHVERNQCTLDIYGDMDMKLKRRIYLVGEIFKNVLPKGLRAVACVNDDLVLILVGSTLVAYHVKGGGFRILGSDCSRTVAGSERYLPYVNSLVEI